MKTLPIFFVLFCLFLISCDKKDQEEQDRICFYYEYEPALLTEEYDSLTIDFDDDGVDDIVFLSNMEEGVFGIEAKTPSKEVEIAKGTNQFSGSYIVIYENNEINSNLSWFTNLPIAGRINDGGYPGIIDYLGIRKKIGDKFCYGWIDVYKTDETFRIKKVYYYKNDDAPVYAGIINDDCDLY